MRRGFPVALLLLASTPLVGRAQQANPYDGNPQAIRAGRALFANRCAECHGADAKGYSGPDLTVLWALGTSDERVFQTLRSGVSGSIMPSFDAPDQELWAIVAYVKSISTVDAADTGPGDPARGRELFETRCTRCHAVGGRGGRMGPDLSRIGAVRTRDALTTAIRDPSAGIPSGYRAVTLVTEEGDRIRGVVKGEDAFSIQIMDTSQELRGFTKGDLAEVERSDDSIMPAFTDARMPATDLDDIVRYLGTLRGTR
jgi:putative heme-binding domain-containing protein